MMRMVLCNVNERVGFLQSMGLVSFIVEMIGGWVY